MPTKKSQKNENASQGLLFSQKNTEEYEGYYASQFTNSSHDATLNKNVHSKVTQPPIIPASVLDNFSSSDDDEEQERKDKKRERNTTNIPYSALSAYFMFSEDEAANRLHISKSKLKRIKKKMNITRWPFRRLQSLQREIANVQALYESTIRNNDSIEESAIALQQRLEALQNTFKFIVRHPNMITKYSNDAIIEILKVTDRVKISNLIHPNNEDIR
jgi:hypothetical protein